MSGSVEVCELGKQFARYDQQRAGSLREAMRRGFRPARITEQFWALRNVSFKVQPGEMLGVIGHNGSGKSTMLRMVGGVMHSDVGSVTTTGRISGLLELNAGMHPELSGRDNILIGGVIAGLTRKQISARMDEVIAFSELEEFIDSPVRTYSMGMRLRLGFAVAIHTDPGVILIDEVLSVGDLAFQSKCLDRIRRHRDEGSAIILITHDLTQVEKLCTDALWLRKGEVVAQGRPDVLVGEYRAAMARDSRQRTPPSMPETVTSTGTILRAHENRFGSMEKVIEAVYLQDQFSKGVCKIATGDALSIAVKFSGGSGPVPIVGVSIGTVDGVNMLDVNTESDNVAISSSDKSNIIRVDLDRVDLTAGSYFVNIGLFHPSWEYAYDYHWQAYPLTITGSHGPSGKLSPPRSWIASAEIRTVRAGGDANEQTGTWLTGA